MLRIETSQHHLRLPGLVKAALPTRHPPLVAPGLAGLPAGPLPPPPDALRLPLASAACMRAATFSCVACSGRPQIKDRQAITLTTTPCCSLLFTQQVHGGRSSIWFYPTVMCIHDQNHAPSPIMHKHMGRGRADLGEALLEVSNLIAHVADLLERLRGRVFCRCYPDLRRVALLCCLQTCHARSAHI